MTVGEVDVFFVEDCCPLEWCSLSYEVSIYLVNNKGRSVFRTMKLLTGRTMTVFTIQRLLPAQLVLDLAAMAASFIASVKVWVVVVDLIGCSMLPFVMLAFSVALVAIVAIGTVSRCLFSHGSGIGVRWECVDAEECSGCWTDGA